MSDKNLRRLQSINNRLEKTRVPVTFKHRCHRQNQPPDSRYAMTETGTICENPRPHPVLTVLRQ